MENSIGGAIELIKFQEKEKEAKLKEKRELDTTLASLNRAIRDASQRIEKFKQDEIDLIKRTDSLRAQLEVERIRRDAISAQVHALQKDISKLRINSDQGITKVWEMRSSLCKTVQAVSDECDVWALLMRPTPSEYLTRCVKKYEYVEPKLLNSERLQKAIEKRSKLETERHRLMTEPEMGEEFIRIKNALRYSLEMTENLQK